MCLSRINNMKCSACSVLWPFRGFKYLFRVHHLNSAQRVAWTLEPLAPSLLNYAQLSLLKNISKHLLWPLMEETTPNALQHTSQAALSKASHFLLNLDDPHSRGLAWCENTNTNFIAFPRRVHYGSLCSENWYFESLSVCSLEALLNPTTVCLEKKTPWPYLYCQSSARSRTFSMFFILL